MWRVTSGAKKDNTELLRQVDLKMAAHCVHCPVKKEKLTDSALQRVPDEVSDLIGELLVPNLNAKQIASLRGANTKDRKDKTKREEQEAN